MRFIGMHWTDIEVCMTFSLIKYRKAHEMERELVGVGMNLKALEVHEERALQRENSFFNHIQSLQNRIKEVKMMKVLGSAVFSTTDLI